MRKFDLSCRLLSEAFWNRVFDHAEPRRRQVQDTIFSELGALDLLRSKAQYNTGSISTATQWVLYSLAYYWRPEIAAEVGTFIGKSAVAFAMGCDAAGLTAEIHTCDMSNSIRIPSSAVSILFQYQGLSSTRMFEEMLKDGYQGRVNLLHLDGRATQEDIPLMASLLSSDGLVVLDDFEGVEKGVANAFALRSMPHFSKHILIYPPSVTLLRSYGLSDFSSTAILMPQSVIRLTAQ